MKDSLRIVSKNWIINNIFGLFWSCWKRLFPTRFFNLMNRVYNRNFNFARDVCS